MGLLRNSFLVVAACAVIAAQAAGAGAAEPPTPEYMRTADERLSPSERAGIAVRSLRDEVRNPAPGPYTEAANRHHRMLRMMLDFMGHKTVKHGIDPRVVRQAANASAPGAEQDALVLLLGLLGDVQATPYLVDYLRNLGNPPYLRVVAARALGRQRDPKVIEVLLRVAETDPAWERAAKRAVINSTRSTHKAFIVRAAAYIALGEYDRDLLLPEPAKARLKGVSAFAEFED